MKILFEFLSFLKTKKKLWLTPIILVIFLVGSLLFITQGTVIAPFIYTLF